MLLLENYEKCEVAWKDETCNNRQKKKLFSVKTKLS